MPFQSEAQRKYLWANRPDIARRWSHKYGGKTLGELAHSPKKGRRRKKRRHV